MDSNRIERLLVKSSNSKDKQTTNRGYSGYTALNIHDIWPAFRGPGRVAQSVTCLATHACLTADPGVEFDPGPILSWRLIMK